MISHGFKFTAVPIKNFHVLGTPQQIIEFSKTYPSSPKRFCFDLDNTLVTYPKINNDYTSVEPIHETINYLKKLKENGHTIIIYTARRMRTHSGNVGGVIADIGQTTIETLKKFNIPYDELYFGKPYAHFYIDDLMVDPKSDLNRSLGYYMEDVVPRHFNSVEKGKTFIKKSKEKKLQGEKFYYLWVQNNSTDEVKNLFPKLLSYDEESIELEFLNGLNFSTMYVNEILSKEHLDKLLLSIETLHKYKENESIIKKFEPLSGKFRQRMIMYDFEKYGLTSTEVETLTQNLEEIEIKGFQNVLIHGDCVFSNIIVDSMGEIKFVDTRGLVDNTFTPYGFYLYDYAKIYQSIIGYDEILMDKKIKISYKQMMKDYFESKFDVNVLNDIKTIAVSLLFSLIPLHNEVDKFQKYIDLGKETLKNI
jgi:capsule biosynthesis phosphatase